MQMTLEQLALNIGPMVEPKAKRKYKIKKKK